jgi:hypothetical protein
MPIPLGILAVAGAGAAGGASSYDLLETTVLSSSASSVTFSSLGSYSAYKHLQIRTANRTDRSGFASDDIALQMNADTGANYRNHGLYGDGSSVASFDAAASEIRIGLTSGVTETANIFGAFVIDILDFASSSKNTTIRALSGKEGSGDYIALTSGLWINTAAVTSILIKPRNATNFIAGSRFSLYGVK